jgi:hypothetical protein
MSMTTMTGAGLEAQALEALRQETADALDLAIAAGAPLPMLEALGAASGLLRALGEVPSHALIPTVTARAQEAVRSWKAWQAKSARRVAA